MYVRGAPLIGAAGAYGVWLACLEAGKGSDFYYQLNKLATAIKSARPTAVNLSWAVDEVLRAIRNEENISNSIDTALSVARKIVEDELEKSRNIAKYGLKLIEDIYLNKKDTVNILTHCNAGWLATIDYGTATAPIYLAREKGIPIHVWVDETRPRNQGARLTAWEFQQNDVPCTLICDNTGGHLMQHGLVDIVIVGTDRTTSGGDVANKIGTYLKALAAVDNNIPFYVAAPSSSIDWEIEDGVKEIIIEERNPNEVLYFDGFENGELKNLLVADKDTKAVNYAFDVTPARLVTGLITERGVCSANKESLLKLFPEKVKGNL
jgi:methylthioribose-1-phosphate isomerase